MKKNVISISSEISSEQSKKMLAFQKEVILSVSDCSKRLFEKELGKSKRWLLPPQIEELVKWVWETFSQKFSQLKNLLQELFADVVDDIASLLTVEPTTVN